MSGEGCGRRGDASKAREGELAEAAEHDVEHEQMEMVDELDGHDQVEDEEPGHSDLQQELADQQEQELALRELDILISSRVAMGEPWARRLHRHGARAVDSSGTCAEHVGALGSRCRAVQCRGALCVCNQTGLVNTMFLTPRWCLPGDPADLDDFPTDITACVDLLAACVILPTLTVGFCAVGCPLLVMLRVRQESDGSHTVCWCDGRRRPVSFLPNRACITFTRLIYSPLYIALAPLKTLCWVGLAAQRACRREARDLRYDSHQRRHVALVRAVWAELRALDAAKSGAARVGRFALRWSDDEGLAVVESDPPPRKPRWSPWRQPVPRPLTLLLTGDRGDGGGEGGGEGGGLGEGKEAQTTQLPLFVARGVELSVRQSEKVRWKGVRVDNGRLLLLGGRLPRALHLIDDAPEPEPESPEAERPKMTIDAPRAALCLVDVNLDDADADADADADDDDDADELALIRVDGPLVGRGLRGAFPARFECRGVWNLAGCGDVVGLPESMTSATVLQLSETGVQALPAGLREAEFVDLQGSASFTTVPAGLRVAMGLWLPRTAVEVLPAVHVGRDLLLNDCAMLRSLEAGLTVGGDLVLDGCTALTGLPVGLTVGGDLSLNGCAALEALPEDLVVNGSLVLADCTSLARVPASVRVRGQGVDVTNCEALFSLPLEPFQVPRNERLVISIAGSSIVGDAADELRDGVSTDVVVLAAFDFGDEDEDGNLVDGTLRIDMSTVADVAREFRVQPSDLARFLDAAHLRGVTVFLCRLLDSAEFKEEALRPGLKARVAEVLEVMESDAVAREEMVLRMLDAIDACDDKPIWALNQMQVVAATAHARGDRAALRSLGRGIMRLGIVHEHARAEAARGREDDVSVYMHLEILLREPLQLPVTSATSFFTARIPQERIDAIRDEALGVSEEAFREWLAAWPEWVRQDRTEAVVPYAALRAAPPRDALRPDEEADAQGFVDLVGDPLRDPVRVIPDRTTAWSYNDVVAQWVRTGRDMANNELPVGSFEASVLRLWDSVASDVANDTKRASLGRRRSRPRASLEPQPEDGAANATWVQSLTDSVASLAADAATLATGSWADPTKGASADDAAVPAAPKPEPEFQRDLAPAPNTDDTGGDDDN